MVSSFRQFLKTYSEICTFYSAIQYILSKKQPVESANEVLAEYWKLSLMMKLILQSIFIIYTNPQPSSGTPFPQTSHFSSIPQAEQLLKLLSSRHIRNSLSVYLFLNSELYVGKLIEFNSQELTVTRNFKYYILLLPSKTLKNRKALHEIIRASSFTRSFVQFSLKSVYLTMVVKIFKFMESYNS